MIHRLEVPELEITDCKYQYDRTVSHKIIPSQTTNPSTCKDYKSFR